MVTEDQYAELRKIEDCDTLYDLKATVTDGAHIMKIADEIGVEDEYRFVDISPTFADMKKTFNKILKITRRLSVEGKPHLLIVYIGGHGATLDEKQMYLLNSSDPKSAIFAIEYKLRYLTNDPSSLIHIGAVFDCCRVNMAKVKGLNAGRGKTDGGMETLSSDD